jgi:hypothetical protein
LHHQNLLRTFYNESVSYCNSMHFTSFQTRGRLSAEYKWHSSSTYGTLKTFRGPSPFHSQIIMEDCGVLPPVEMVCLQSLYSYNHKISFLKVKFSWIYIIKIISEKHSKLTGLDCLLYNVLLIQLFQALQSFTSTVAN